MQHVSIHTYSHVCYILIEFDFLFNGGTTSTRGHTTLPIYADFHVEILAIFRDVDKKVFAGRRLWVNVPSFFKTIANANKIVDRCRVVHAGRPRHVAQPLPIFPIITPITPWFKQPHV